jgi:hypothetical protein
MKTNFTKLSIMDFDGTLISTPLPDTGKIEYEKKTGNPWPHKGWWGQLDSLDMKIFDMPSIPSVVADYHIEKADANTALILVTGRMVKLGGAVKKILDAKGLTFDEYHYNTGGATDIVKVKTFNELLIKYPTVEFVEIWEDRINHVQIFEQWGKEQCLSGRLKDFKVNVVISQERDGLH